MQELIAVIRKREQTYRDALDVVLNSSEDNMEPELHDACQALREAVELVSCLRRALPSLTRESAHKVLGAPGDWGYDTEIGDALAKYYRRAWETT